MDVVNHQVRLAARPVGLPKPSDWSYTEEPVPEPGADEVLVKIHYIGLEPAMRGWMNEGRSYIAPVAIGEVMRGFAAGEVIASNFPGLAVGDHVSGLLGVQEYAVANGNAVAKVDTELAPLADVSRHARPAGHDRVLRSAGDRATRRGRDRGRVRRRGRRRGSGGADRQAQGLPGRSGSPAGARSAATWWRTSVSTRPSTTRPKT